MTDTQFTIADYTRKIQALLAKAEGTDNEAEQKAFSEKAERLMIKMGISAAELEAAGQARTDDIIEVSHVWTTIYAPVMTTFTNDVAAGYGNLRVLQSRWGKDRVKVWVIGHKSDTEQFMSLLLSLHVQVFLALKAFRKENRQNRRWNTIHENFVIDRSFIEGYGAAVAMRLREMRREETADATPGAALVLVSRKERVDDWVGEQYPSLRMSRTRAQQASWEGRSAGSRAGANASLGGNSLPGKGKAVRS